MTFALRRLLPCLLFVSGCGPASNINANDSVTVSGHVQRADGSALTDQPVVLIRHPDALQLVADLTATVASLGLACLDANNSLCQPFRTATSKSDGSFAYPAIKGSDTQGTAAAALLFTSVVTGAVPSGYAQAPVVATDFYMQQDTIQVPTQRLWQPALVDSAPTGDANFTWTSLQTDTGIVADGYTVQILTQAGDLVWSQTVLSPQLQIDARITQDFAGTWSVSALHTVAASPESFQVTSTSPSLTYANRQQVPPSRGAACAVQNGNSVQAITPCPLTDGSLATGFVPISCPAQGNCTAGGQNNWFMLDLGSPQTLHDMVLYAVSIPANTTLRIDGSNDAATWTPLATPSTDAFQVVSISPLAPATRYVQFRLDPSSAQFTGAGFTEIAIY